MPLFSITIKCHYLLHLGFHCQQLNPRLSICYNGEDYMHQMKILISKTANGNNAAQVSSKMCSKIRLWMHVRYLRSGFLRA